MWVSKKLSKFSIDKRKRERGRVLIRSNFGKVTERERETMKERKREREKREKERERDRERTSKRKGRKMESY